MTTTKTDIKKTEDGRPFDLSFSLRNKRDPENPFATVTLKGEISKKIILTLAALGAVASVITVFKIVRFIRSFF